MTSLILGEDFWILGKFEEYLHTSQCCFPLFLQQTSSRNTCTRHSAVSLCSSNRPVDRSFERPGGPLLESFKFQCCFRLDSLVRRSGCVSRTETGTTISNDDGATSASISFVSSLRRKIRRSNSSFDAGRRRPTRAFVEGGSSRSRQVSHRNSGEGGLAHDRRNGAK